MFASSKGNLIIVVQRQRSDKSNIITYNIFIRSTVQIDNEECDEEKDVKKIMRVGALFKGRKKRKEEEEEI